jgi:hypothetical protein
MASTRTQKLGVTGPPPRKRTQTIEGRWSGQKGHSVTAPLAPLSPAKLVPLFAAADTRRSGPWNSDRGGAPLTVAEAVRSFQGNGFYFYIPLHSGFFLRGKMENC